MKNIFCLDNYHILNFSMYVFVLSILRWTLVRSNHLQRRGEAVLSGFSYLVLSCRCRLIVTISFKIASSIWFRLLNASFRLGSSSTGDDLEGDDGTGSFRVSGEVGSKVLLEVLWVGSGSLQ
jgi:hypothetical protein